MPSLSNKDINSMIVARALAVLVLASLGTCRALITEQQLGAVDWHRQFVGRVTHAVFAPSNRPRVYVASEAGALAALNLRNGHILWRQASSSLLFPSRTLQRTPVQDRCPGRLPSRLGPGRAMPPMHPRTSPMAHRLA